MVSTYRFFYRVQRLHEASGTTPFNEECDEPIHKGEMFNIKGNTYPSEAFELLKIVGVETESIVLGGSEEGLLRWGVWSTLPVMYHLAFIHDRGPSISGVLKSRVALARCPVEPSGQRNGKH